MLLDHSLTSPYSRKVRVLLLEKGIPHESIDMRSSGRRAAEHNPLGKVPTVVLGDGTVLFDSVVITEALEALHQICRSWRADPRVIDRAIRVCYPSE
jgi:glutathione S-transferase